MASKGATEGFYNAIDTLREAGGAAIGEIRAFARSRQNPDVYIMAGIPAPASPSPVPAPPAPTNLTITMQTTGEAVLRWKVKQPAPGAEIITVVQRRLNAAGPFVEFASTGEKTITDSTIPPGTKSVSYVLRARRGDQMSAPSEPVTHSWASRATKRRVKAR